MIIGLTGSIGTGKSQSSKIFKELGCYIIDADKISSLLTTKGSKSLKDVVENFGTDILTSQGYLNRKKLAQIIFNDKQAKRDLERILHPHIIKKINEIIAKKYKSVDIVVDAPLLFEVGLDRICDKIIVIYAKYHLQLKRLSKRDKISKNEAINRIALQMPIEDKMQMADITIDNSSTLSELKKNIKFVYMQLRQR
ncbi:MAG: dephospho-CoA kinase [Endomicrobiaceae bacterium]|jgi:dephospho-CoA kinase|nr:dephospho-CoA kinase [Endomicrobiaceae bacterium]MDD3052829.1 dephospho-CoA kinase [Endomicrobiaceae bacterium]MDD3921961.1 dephospho-CoA kinase [Endomicrobiaceae bacterium]